MHVRFYQTILFFQFTYRHRASSPVTICERNGRCWFTMAGKQRSTDGDPIIFWLDWVHVTPTFWAFSISCKWLRNVLQSIVSVNSCDVCRLSSWRKIVYRSSFRARGVIQVPISLSEADKPFLRCSLDSKINSIKEKLYSIEFADVFSWHYCTRLNLKRRRCRRC